MSVTRAVGASSTWRDYSFPSPIAALLWREIAGHEPFWFLIGTEPDWQTPKRNQAVIAAFDHWGLSYQRLDPIHGYEVSTQAQNIRQIGMLWDRWGADDWLMPTDADLWPLKRDFYRQHEANGKRATCLYSNGDNFVSKENVLNLADQRKGYQTLPTCHVVMQAKTWREVYGYGPTSDLRGLLKTYLDAWLWPRQQGKTPSEASWEAWMSDQRIMTERLCRMDWFPQDVALVPRHGQPPSDRLDRGHPADWENVSVGKWTDSHIVRPADQEPHWPKIRELLKNAVPQHMDYIDGYRKAFVEGY